MKNKMNTLVGFLVITLVLAYVAVISKGILDSVDQISAETSNASVIVKR